MLLPNKYVGFNKSFVCVAACVFDLMGKKPVSIERLWRDMCKRYPQIDFSMFIRTLVFLKVCNLIYINEEGKIAYESFKDNL